MKKQLHMISALLAACLFLLALSACAEDPPFDPESLDPPMETELNQVPGAAMEVLHVEADSLLVQINYERPSEDAPDYIMTGEGFWLDWYYEGQWYTLPLSEGKTLGFTDIGYQISFRQPENYEVPFGQFYDPLPPGLYRVVKSAGRGCLAAEFTVE